MKPIIRLDRQHASKKRTRNHILREVLMTHTTRLICRRICGLLTAALLSLAVSTGYAEEIDLGDRGFGIEFFTSVAGKRTFTIDSVTFNGRGDQPLTESQTLNVDIELDNPAYDIVLFYRFWRLKVGWIPTSLIHDDDYRGNAAQYNQPFGAWPLGQYEISTEFVNLLYLEVLGLKARNMFANVALRLDNAEVKGEFRTIKYPFGDEWFQSPIVLSREQVDEDFLLLSLGPKVGYDLKSIDLLNESVLRPFNKAGLDISAFFDIPIGYSDFKGYSVNISLALEF